MTTAPSLRSASRPTRGRVPVGSVASQGGHCPPAFRHVAMRASAAGSAHPTWRCVVGDVSARAHRVFARHVVIQDADKLLGNVLTA